MKRNTQEMSSGHRRLARAWFLKIDPVRIVGMRAWFLKIDPVRIVGMRACVSVPEAINN